MGAGEVKTPTMGSTGNKLSGFRCLPTLNKNFNFTFRIYLQSDLNKVHVHCPSLSNTHLLTIFQVHAPVYAMGPYYLELGCIK